MNKDRIESLQILMPVHNEGKSLEETIDKIYRVVKQKIKFSFIICEDGSNDDTVEILKRLELNYPIKLISHHQKKGYSNAVIDGIKIATSDYLLIMDSDGQCDPSEIFKFWDNRNNADLINGNRVLRVDFLYRKFFSKLAFVVYNFFFKLNLKDPSFAFALMNKKVYTNLSNFKPQMPDGFFWEFNARAMRKGFTFFEVDINHKKRKYGNTKIFHFYKLPRVALINLVGLFKVKFFQRD